MSKFYTNVLCIGNKILYRGYKDGKRDQVKELEFSPTLYVSSSKKQTEWTTVTGLPVESIKPGSIKECKEFVEQYSGVSNMSIYGNTYWHYQYISQEFPGEIEYDPSQIKLAFLDIETETEKGFPDPADPKERINAITLRIDDRKYVFGLNEFNISEPGVSCIVCSDEEELLTKFLEVWNEEDPDVLTGWNVEFFDVPYMVTRITAVLGEKTARKLSPWRVIKPREIERWGKIHTVYNICGVSVLDYYVLYRKYTYTSQEKYTLDHIAEVELGKKKIEYTEYKNLKEFYTKDYQRFMEYNVHDVDLVKELDLKLNLLDLHISIAYTAKINYDDAFSQVRTWDTIIYNHLLTKHKVIPMRKDSVKTEKFAGAYVKEPQLGFSKWIVSFDLNSMYPMTICQLNVCPSKMITEDDLKKLRKSLI
jgi:DNA polymerase elongation subunit (family B)